MRILLSDHSGLAPNGSNTMSAMNQRKNEIVIGGTSPAAARPATELPAQHAEAKTSSAIASQRGIAVFGVGVSRSVTGASVLTIDAAKICLGSFGIRNDNRAFIS